MNNEQDGLEYLEGLIKRLDNFTDKKLGDDLQIGTRLSKTDRGARTNARIEASQKKQPFDETETAEDELDEVDNDITNELLFRELENLFGK
jgi:hypothetical protein